MSGHSKWAKIHRQKAVSDQQRGKVFTKLGKAISIAVKEGGGVVDPEMNFKLRLAIEKAKQANMPRSNIDKAISSGSGPGAGDDLVNITYEGFGPTGVAVIVEVVTDNRNRALSEVKQIFDKSGGTLGQSGSVSFLFNRVGEILVKETENQEAVMLELMEIPGIIDIEQTAEGLNVLTKFNELKSVQDKVAHGHSIEQSSLIYQPKMPKQLNTEQIQKVETFIAKLEDSEEVQNVWTDANIE